MFRGLYHQLYGNDSTHMLLRYVFQEILANNVNKFSCYWGLFTDHIKKLRKSGEWGTQVELQLASEFACTLLHLHQKAPTDGMYSSPKH